MGHSPSKLRGQPGTPIKETLGKNINTVRSIIEQIHVLSEKLVANKLSSQRQELQPFLDKLEACLQFWASPPLNIKDTPGEYVFLLAYDFQLLLTHLEGCRTKLEQWCQKNVLFKSQHHWEQKVMNLITGALDAQQAFEHSLACPPLPQSKAEPQDDPTTPRGTPSRNPTQEEPQGPVSHPEGPTGQTAPKEKVDLADPLGGRSSSREQEHPQCCPCPTPTRKHDPHSPPHQNSPPIMDGGTTEGPATSPTKSLRGAQVGPRGQMPPGPVVQLESGPKQSVTWGRGEAESYLQDIHQLRMKAEEGDLEAVLWLGCALRTGSDQVVQDPVAARKLFIQAAVRGCARSCFLLGEMSEAGEGMVAPNVVDAASWYLRSAEGGCPEGACAWAYMQEHGLGTPVDMPGATRWYEMAAHGGCITAMNNYGRLLLIDITTGSDGQQAAVGWLQAAAQGGSRSAHYNLGQCLEEGLGLKQDRSLAQQHYQQASQLGHRGATLRLGEVLLEQGAGATAMELWRPLADDGDVEVMLRLAELAEVEAVDTLGGKEGCGLSPPGMEVAEAWYTAAADAGSAEAHFKLGELHWERGGNDLALRHYHAAGALGHGGALGKLGRIADHGLGGVEVDKVAAQFCYDLAAAQGL